MDKSREVEEGLVKLQALLDTNVITEDFLIEVSLKKGTLIDSVDSLKNFLEEDFKAGRNLLNRFLREGTDVFKHITKRKLVKAIKISLFSSDTRNWSPLTDTTYLSDIFINDAPVITHMSKLGKIMTNPLAWLFTEEGFLHYSIVRVDEPKIPIINHGNKRFQISQDVFYPAMSLKYLYKHLYHPLIWYLIQEGILLKSIKYFGIEDLLSEYGKLYMSNYNTNA